jgi:hypothetical protein
MNQRVEEIEAEPYCDDQSDDRLRHGAALLKLPEGERVDAHQRQNRNTERNERNVEHDRLLVGALLTAESRKLSILNRALRNKDFEKKQVARTSFAGFVRTAGKPRRTSGSVQSGLQSAKIL